jgi:hypothetical protein
MSPNLYFDRKQVGSFRELLALYPRRAFASPYRSTIPLLALVKDAWPVFIEIADTCGSNNDIRVHFEFKVKAPGVKGNPSHTDAMVLSPVSALALEAKWTEPRYESVTERLRSPVAGYARRNKHKEPLAIEEYRQAQRGVINAWLSLLAGHSNSAVNVDVAGAIVYQMIHRAASACSTTLPASLVYLHFSTPHGGHAAPASHYRNDLQRLHRLIGSPMALRFYLVDLPLQPTAAFDAIAALPKGAIDTDIKVRAAIESTCLFEFGRPTTESIS